MINQEVNDEREEPDDLNPGRKWDGKENYIVDGACAVAPPHAGVGRADHSSGNIQNWRNDEGGTAG